MQWQNLNRDFCLKYSIWLSAALLLSVTISVVVHWEHLGQSSGRKRELLYFHAVEAKQIWQALQSDDRDENITSICASRSIAQYLAFSEHILHTPAQTNPMKKPSFWYLVKRQRNF